MELQYHRNVFTLVQQIPTFNPEAERELRAVEQAYNVVLPPSVREWYSLTESISLLKYYSRDDYIFDLKAIQEEAEGWLEGDLYSIDIPRPPLEFTVIPFLVDCQGVFVACLLMDGTDDPPVLKLDDDREWKLWSDHFSDFLLGWVWRFFREYEAVPMSDYTAFRPLPTLLSNSVGAFTDTLSLDTLYFLKSKFSQLKPLYPPSMLYQFVNDNSKVYLWQRADYVEWWIYADSFELFSELIKQLSVIDDIEQTLHRWNAGAQKLLKLLRPTAERYWEPQINPQRFYEAYRPQRRYTDKK